MRVSTLALLLGAAAFWAPASAAKGFGLIGIDIGNEFMKVSLVKPGMPFQISINLQSKRKTPTLLGFYQGERVFGADAEAIAARKPFNVFPDAFRLLGRNVTHPAVEDYTTRSYIAAGVVANERAGVSFVVPPDAGKPSVHYSAEEATAMLLAHAKEFTEAFGDASVKDAVITVPSYFTQSERVALLDAAALAGLRVLTLVDENTAAGIHYGMDRVFSNSTHYMALYNMGSEATQVTLFAFDAYNTTDRSAAGARVNKTVGQATVLAKAWDTSLGGRHFDRVLVEYVADRFNADPKMVKAMPSEARGDIRNLPNSMAKIRKNVGKAKEVLSANEEYQVFVESVVGDADFRIPLSRAILEEQAAKAGLIARIVEPIRSVLAQANVSLGQLDVVELVGGGVRMPRVQAELKAFLAEPSSSSSGGKKGVELGQHLNGDEAMALGAAFVAANRSSSFRVRQVGMIDAYPWAVGVRLTHLQPGASSGVSLADTPARGEEVDDAASSAGKPWHKRSSLFRAYSPVNSTKRISFTADRELRAVLFYEAAAPEDAPLPVGTARTVGAFNITGIEDMIARIAALAATPSASPTPEASAVDQADGESTSAAPSASASPQPLPLTFIGAPKVHVTFELDTSGVVRALRAEGTAEEEYTPTATPKPRATPTPLPKLANVTSSNATTAANATVNSTSLNETAAANSTTTADAVAENATVSDTSASPSPTPKTARRTIRFALVVTPAPADESAVGSVVHFGPSERAASSVTLADLAARDDAKRAVERAKSTLEAFVYSSRDRLDAASSDEESDLLTVSTSEQREGVSSALSEAESWLYDDGATADVAAYEAKLETVQALVNPLLRRADEFGRRPRVINETRALISGIADAIAAWNSTHPQVTINETIAASSALFKFETYFNETLAKQEALLPHEDPVLTEAGVARQAKSVTDVVQRLARKPKPTPTPTPTPTPSAKSTPAKGSKRAPSKTETKKKGTGSSGGKTGDSKKAKPASGNAKTSKPKPAAVDDDDAAEEVDDDFDGDDSPGSREESDDASTADASSAGEEDAEL